MHTERLSDTGREEKTGNFLSREKKSEQKQRGTRCLLGGDSGWVVGLWFSFNCLHRVHEEGNVE